MDDFRRTPFMPPVFEGTITPRTPTWRESLTGLLAASRGEDDRKGYRDADFSIRAFESLPLVGQIGSGILAGNEAYRAGREGDYTKAGLLGLAAVAPLPPGVRAAAKPAERKILRSIDDILSLNDSTKSIINTTILPEKEFRKLYSQHIDLRNRGKDAQKVREKIMLEGWKPGFGPNTMPIYDPKAPANITTTLYAPQKGDVIYLPLNKEMRKVGKDFIVKEGWKPKPYEAVIVEYDNQNPYELYKKAIESMGKK